VGDRPGQLVGGDLETLLDSRADDDGLGAREPDLLGVRDPVRGGQNRLVAGLQDREARLEQGVLATGRDADLVGGVGETAGALQVIGDGSLEVREARRRHDVAVVPVADGLDAGLADVRGGLEVRLAGAETDDVGAVGLHALGLGGGGQGHGGLDALDALGDVHDSVSEPAA